MIMKVKFTHLFPNCTLSLPPENTRKLYGVEQGCTGSKWVKKPELQLQLSRNTEKTNYTKFYSVADWMFEPLRIYLANHYGKPFVQNFVCINPFHATRLFLYALKTSKKTLAFLIISRGIERDYMNKMN